MSISKLALACSLALGAATLCFTPVTQAAKAAVKHPVAAVEPNPEEDEPDTSGSTTTEFNCELGNKVTIYSNDGDDAHVALRWKKRLHRLTRVGTTTGALRFENTRLGLVWIGIPAKGMLLDSKLNRQLANECRNAEQTKPADATAPAAEKKT